MGNHVLVVFCKGIFVCGGSKGKHYVGGTRKQMDIDVESFVFSSLLKVLKDMCGNLEIKKVYFRKPDMAVENGFLLLCGGTTGIFIE